MQDTNRLQGKMTTHFPAAEDWIQSINSRCTCKFRKSALSIVLFFLFSQTIFEINSSMIPFILCKYSSLTSSSKLWANSGIKVPWPQFQSCRNLQPSPMSRLTTMDHNSCAVPPLHGKIANFAFITHNPLPIPECFSGGWSAPLTLCSHAQPLLFCDSPNIWTKPSSRRNGSLLATWAFSGCSPAISCCMEGDSSRITESFRLAKTLKATKSWQVLFVSCSKVCIHKLCCIVVQYRGWINAQLHHPRNSMYGAARRMTSILDAQWQRATAAPNTCPACHHCALKAGSPLGAIRIQMWKPSFYPRLYLKKSWSFVKDIFFLALNWPE